MTFDLNEKRDASILRIGGELDALSTHDLNPVTERIAKRHPAKVLVDLSDLRLIDSSGVGTIVALFKTVRAYHGELALVGVQDQPLAILRLLGLDRILMGGVDSAAARPYAFAAPAQTSPAQTSFPMSTENGEPAPQSLSHAAADLH